MHENYRHPYAGWQRRKPLFIGDPDRLPSDIPHDRYWTEDQKERASLRSLYAAQIEVVRPYIARLFETSGDFLVDRISRVGNR